MVVRNGTIDDIGIRESLLEFKVKGNRDPGAVDEMSEVRFSFGGTDGLGACTVCVLVLCSTTN